MSHVINKLFRMLRFSISIRNNIVQKATFCSLSPLRSCWVTSNSYEWNWISFSIRPKLFHIPKMRECWCAEHRGLLSKVSLILSNNSGILNVHWAPCFKFNTLPVFSNLFIQSNVVFNSIRPANIAMTSKVTLNCYYRFRFVITDTVWCNTTPCDWRTEPSRVYNKMTPLLYTNDITLQHIRHIESWNVSVGSVLLCINKCYQNKLTDISLKLEQKVLIKCKIKIYNKFNQFFLTSTSAVNVSNNFSFASSPMYIFVPSFTKSLSFSVGKSFPFSRSEASLSTVDPFRSNFLEGKKKKQKKVNHFIKCS